MINIKQEISHSEIYVRDCMNIPKLWDSIKEKVELKFVKKKCVEILKKHKKVTQIKSFKYILW